MALFCNPISIQGYNAGQSLKKYILLKKGELAYNPGASKAKQFGCCYELLKMKH